MNALAGLMNPAAIGADVQNAFEVGREKMKQQQTESALSAYAANPDDPMAFQAVAKYAPKFAIQIGADRREQEQKAAAAALRQAAAQGDKKALLTLWGVDSAEAKRLDDRQADEALKGFNYAAESMFAISQLPEEQQPAAFDRAIDQGVEMGFDGLATYKGKYNPQLRDAMLARAGQMQEFQSFNRPQYMAAPEGAGLINVKDPAAINAWNSGVTASEPTTKVINGNTYYNVGGKWYDELPQGGSVGNGADGF